MNFIGVDLHKKSITICVLNENLKVLARKTVFCDQTDQIVEFFRPFRPFKVVVEATASYLWFVELVEPLAEEVVLANPKKLRVIAESTKKTDRLDAQVLAEFLARDQIPRAYMPTPRQRQHRRLVRHRQYLRQPMTSVRCKIRHILSDYNADRKDLFSTQCGPAYFIVSEVGDVSRFRNAKAICAYAGLVPRVRQTGGKKSKDLRITKEGSGLLRWALVESAWRLVKTSPKWSAFFSQLRKRSGSKRAIFLRFRRWAPVCHLRAFPVQVPDKAPEAWTRSTRSEGGRQLAGPQPGRKPERVQAGHRRADP